LREQGSIAIEKDRAFVAVREGDKSRAEGGRHQQLRSLLFGLGIERPEIDASILWRRTDVVEEMTAVRQKDRITMGAVFAHSVQSSDGQRR
jgi:hypothetical protein